MPAPPTRCSSNARSWATGLRISTAEAATSGPIPSPGRRTIFGISWVTLQIQGDRARAFPGTLVRGDLVRLAQREIDVVQPVEQAVAAFLVQVERHGFAGEADLFGLEVDLGAAGPHQRLDLLL